MGDGEYLLFLNIGEVLCFVGPAIGVHVDGNSVFVDTEEAVFVRDGVKQRSLKWIELPRNGRAVSIEWL
jgi:hypothetical protein